MYPPLSANYGKYRASLSGSVANGRIGVFGRTSQTFGLL
jgi:hypothetical protein